MFTKIKKSSVRDELPVAKHYFFRLLTTKQFPRFVKRNCFNFWGSVYLVIDNYRNYLFNGKWFEHAYCVLSARSGRSFPRSRWPDLNIDKEHSNEWNALIGHNQPPIKTSCYLVYGGSLSFLGQRGNYKVSDHITLLPWIQQFMISPCV